MLGTAEQPFDQRTIEEKGDTRRGIVSGPQTGTASVLVPLFDDYADMKM